jgi:drug/metabolite transporter (DMT)-like permease
MDTAESKIFWFDWLFSSRWNWLFVLLIVELICILGDYYIKKASMEDNWNGWKLLGVGCVLYGVSAIGFFYLMRSFKVFTVGMLHSFAVIFLSVVLSLFVFNEKINAREILGLILGIASILLLVRFQE